MQQIMFSRAFNGSNTKKNPRAEESSQSQYYSLREDEDCIAGLMGDLPLTFCGAGEACPHKTRWRDYLCLREVSKASVQVMGESDIGISEKVVLLDGRVYATKRFRKVSVSKRGFEKRVERIAQVSKGSEVLVEVEAYLYAKRIKVVLSDYFPMGSLADLLDGARELGHTPLRWDQRLRIMRDVARAVDYIHDQVPAQEIKNLKLNVHGNIKTSNIMIKTDFSACLSEYGFVQLAALEPATAVETAKSLQKHKHQQQQQQQVEAEKFTMRNDIYAFGLVVLEMLGGPKAPMEINCISKRKDEINAGILEFFEFSVEGRERKQALEVLDVALSCTNKFPETRPCTRSILFVLDNL